VNEDDTGAARVRRLDPHWPPDGLCRLLADECRCLGTGSVHVAGIDAVPGVPDRDLAGAVGKDPRKDRLEWRDLVAEVRHQGFSFVLTPVMWATLEVFGVSDIDRVARQAQ